VEKLVVKLQAKIKKEVRISTKIDKAILGGVVIRIGDQIIDASIKKEIEAFRNNY
jgi:F-type H+-transporting ATPase subunit delta